MYAITCSPFPASRKPTSTSSTNRCGPQSACRKKRAGSWEWSRDSSSVRPHVKNGRDSRLRFCVVLQVVDVSLAGLDGGRLGAAWVGITRNAGPLFDVPDQMRVEEARPASRLDDLSDFTCARVQKIDMRRAGAVSSLKENLATGRRCIRMDPGQTGQE